MAFTLETGSGVAGANAYVDTTFADTYHDDRGHTAWATDSAGAAVTTAAKQAAIIRATDHVDRVHGTRFRGYKETSAQGLEWPRTNAYDDNGYVLSNLPAPLKNAIAEYALRALVYGALTPDPPPLSPRQDFSSAGDLPAYGDSIGAPTLVREKIGPIETEIRSSANPSGQVPLPSYPAADRLLTQLLRPGTSTFVRG